MRVEGRRAARPFIAGDVMKWAKVFIRFCFPPSVRAAYIMLAILSRSNSTSRSFIFFVCSSVLIQAHRVFILPEGRRRRETSPAPQHSVSRWPHCVVILLLLLLDILLLALAIFAGLIFLGQLLFFPALYSAVDCGNPPSSFSPAHAYVNGCCRYNLFEWCLL